MNISDAGLSLIKEFESLRLVAYLPTPDDVPTIGYGSTKGVKLGMEITPERAEELLREDVADAEDCVNRRTKGINITQGQYDALVSLCFNIGCGAFSGSTLLRCLLDGDDDGAANQFARWNKQGKKVLAGLTRRRAAEEALFRS